MALIARGRPVVFTLSIFWIILVLWQEYLQFAYDGNQCEWPDHSFKDDDNLRPQHVLIIADPQILDHRSYPGRGRFLTWLSRVIVDLNLRKNWWVATSKQPDAVVVLGDMMDGGRFDMPDEEYEGYYQRFKSIFKLDPSIPQYFIPGNHDTGLGFSQTFSPYTHIRYTTHFGPKNYQIELANHTLVFIDAPGFVDEEYKRLGMSKTYENWKPLAGGTLEFMKRFKKEALKDPVILFTHVPLYRPDGRGCGPLRERGTIRPGVGNGYQNTLGKQSSQKLLELLNPSLIFSGDDHDYCEHTHHLSSSTSSQPGGRPLTIREITVKSLSMAMGIKRPGFQLLSLAPTPLRPAPAAGDFSSAPTTSADVPCLLPDQLHSYLGVYIPLGVLSLMILGACQFVPWLLRVNKPNIKHSVDLGSGYYEGLNDGGVFKFFSPTRLLRPRRDGPDLEAGSGAAGSTEKKGWYSHSLAQQDGPFTKMVKYLVALAGSIASLVGSKTRHPGRRRTGRSSKLAGFLYDTRDVIVWPLGTFIIITWWFSFS